MACVQKFTPHPKSAPGDFYVVKGRMSGLAEVPLVVAPDLVGWTGGEDSLHCFWKKQPKTLAELERAIAVHQKPKNWNATDIEELTLQFLTECCVRLL